MKKTISDLLAQEVFFRNMTKDQLDFIAGCATNVHYRDGEFIGLRGKLTTHFYLIRKGRVAFEVEAANRTVIIQTVAESDVIGWSWLQPPYTWRYDVRALDDVSAIAFDAKCVREKCEADPVFGFEMYKRFTRIVIERLEATREQLTDMYA
ncbi:MAG TPA: cyclic nucleotide-binding domain-containing protein [Rhodothermales bacterium]|nr:cyclic nucleotide-binding domain-containing protein [Rhodothermales bacterium]